MRFFQYVLKVTLDFIGAPIIASSDFNFFVRAYGVWEAVAKFKKI